MKTNLQKKYRNEEFSCDQYWILHFTEMLRGEIQENYRTIIKARSGQLAKEILINRMEEEENEVKLVSVLVYYVHKDYRRMSGVKLGSVIDSWAHIRKIAFPNEFNKLFKLKKEKVYKHGHPMGRGDAHKNASPELKAKRIKQINEATEKKKGCASPKSPEAKKKYGENAWVPLSDSVFREMEINYFRKLLKKNGGNRTLCSKELGLAPPSFRYRLLKFPEVDWVKEYPLIYITPKKTNTEAQRLGRIKATKTLKARGHKYFDFENPEEVMKKMKKNKRKTWDKNKADRLAKIKTSFLEVLRENNFHQKNTGKVFGKGINWVNDRIRDFKEIDPEFKKEFERVKDKKRIENSKKARTEKRLKYLESCKHEILEAYHQNGENYTKASLYLNMHLSTFVGLFKEIQEKTP